MARLPGSCSCCVAQCSYLQRYDDLQCMRCETKGLGKQDLVPKFHHWSPTCSTACGRASSDGGPTLPGSHSGPRQLGAGMKSNTAQHGSPDGHTVTYRYLVSNEWGHCVIQAFLMNLASWGSFLPLQRNVFDPWSKHALNKTKGEWPFKQPKQKQRRRTQMEQPLSDTQLEIWRTHDQRDILPVSLAALGISCKTRMWFCCCLKNSRIIAVFLSHWMSNIQGKIEARNVLRKGVGCNTSSCTLLSDFPCQQNFSPLVTASSGVIGTSCIEAGGNAFASRRLRATRCQNGRSRWCLVVSKSLTLTLETTFGKRNDRKDRQTTDDKPRGRWMTDHGRTNRP